MTDGVDDTSAAEVAPDVAPDVAEGQATDQSSSPLWDSYLKDNEIPEPAHNYVRDALKYHDGLTTQKFQEASEYRKRWEPYEQIDGFDKWEPERLAQALPLIEALDDEEQAYDTVRRMAIHLGLIDEDDDEPVDGEAFIDGDDTLDDEPPSWFQEQFAPVQQFVQQMQEQQRQTEAQAYIDSAFGAIEQELGRKLDDSELEDLKDRAEGYARRGVDDPIAKAWDAHKGFRTQVERQFIGERRQEPGRAEVGHSAPPALPPVDGRLSLEQQAQQALRDRIAALNG